MDCNCNKEKRSYYFDVTEVVDGKIRPVAGFTFGGHHDLAGLIKRASEKYGFTKEKHAAELVLGLRLLHHALKKYPENGAFAEFLGQLDDFKHKLKGDK